MTSYPHPALIEVPVHRRSLCSAVLAALVLVPFGASAASATGPVGPAGSPFKSAFSKRLPGPVPVAVAPKIGPVPAPSTFDQRVLALTNAERTARGLRALAGSTCAGGYADSWAGTLATTDSLAHQPLSPILAGCAASSVGENVGYGNVTPEQMVSMWMASPGHRANILNATYTAVGVGSQTRSDGRVYGVQVFLTR